MMLPFHGRFEQGNFHPGPQEVQTLIDDELLNNLRIPAKAFAKFAYDEQTLRELHFLVYSVRKYIETLGLPTGWTTGEHEGRTYYISPPPNQRSQWERPGVSS